MGTAYGTGNIIGFGGLNGGNSNSNANLDLTDALLQQLVNEYCTPKVWEKWKGVMQPGDVHTLYCGGDPIHRVIVQTFDNAPLSVFINEDSVAGNDAPDFQLNANGFPSVIPVPGMPWNVTIRNDSTKAASVVFILSSAAG